MMPEMSGVDLYEALRRVSPEHARRMIFLTGGAFTATALTFLESVDNHRLEKPFDAATLLAVVSRSLGS